MCLYPAIVRKLKSDVGISNYKPVPCGRCIECQKSNRKYWYNRLLEEYKKEQKSVFVTMTFSGQAIKQLTSEIKESSNNIHNDIVTLAIRRFFERWRKKHKTSVKHWLVTEIGGHNSENINLHGIIFTDNKKDIEKIWQYGYIYIGDYVTENTISYIVKYLHNDKNYVKKVFSSPNIGKDYLLKMSKINRYEI